MELFAAHHAIRPVDGPRIPYYIGYTFALAEAERHLDLLSNLDLEAEEAVDRLTNIQSRMERWYTAWGL